MQSPIGITFTFASVNMCVQGAMKLWMNYRKQKFKKVRVVLEGKAFTAVALSDDSLDEDDIVLMQAGRSLFGGVKSVVAQISIMKFYNVIVNKLCKYANIMLTCSG